MSDFILVYKEQFAALAEVAEEAKCKALLVMPMDNRDGLIVVGPSRYDMRRWDIGSEGQIVRRDRSSGDGCYRNRFPRRIMETVPGWKAPARMRRASKPKQSLSGIGDVGSGGHLASGGVMGSSAVTGHGMGGALGGGGRL